MVAPLTGLTHDREAELEDVEVHHETHVVTGKLQRGQPPWAQLPGLRHGQQPLGLQPRTVEDIVQAVLLLARVPDLPCGPGPLVSGIR